jgi:hypothetical protein
MEQWSFPIHIPPTIQVHEAMIERGAYPSPYNYYNFPKSVCTSVNEVICHGIPDARELQNGDIINVDITAYLNGFHGDLNETFTVGFKFLKPNQLLSWTTLPPTPVLSVALLDDPSSHARPIPNNFLFLGRGGGCGGESGHQSRSRLPDESTGRLQARRAV